MANLITIPAHKLPTNITGACIVDGGEAVTIKLSNVGLREELATARVKHVTPIPTASFIKGVLVRRNVKVAIVCMYVCMYVWRVLVCVCM